MSGGHGYLTPRSEIAEPVDRRRLEMGRFYGNLSSTIRLFGIESLSREAISTAGDDRRLSSFLGSIFLA
jgi:hypothetical protein